MKENKQPILSICIPTYNREKLLKESLSKIIEQISNNKLSDKVEIIISDNASSDDTSKIVSWYWYNFLRYFKNDINIGGNNNVIKVTEYANWEYLWLLTDDDQITDFALKYVLEIIEKEKFDIMLCNAISSENMDVQVPCNENEYNLFNWIHNFLSYLGNQNLWYKDLISYFSFYSILIVKTQYFREWLAQYSSIIEWNDFPQDMIVYHDLKDKKIIVPSNTFVIWRLLNESYVWSTKLIKSFSNCMNFIEERNDLNENKNWLKIKNICKRWWRKNIILWLIIWKLHIDYKHNNFLKRIYWFYKKYIQ